MGRYLGQEIYSYGNGTISISSAVRSELAAEPTQDLDVLAVDLGSEGDWPSAPQDWTP